MNGHLFRRLALKKGWRKSCSSPLFLIISKLYFPDAVNNDNRQRLNLYGEKNESEKNNRSLYETLEEIEYKDQKTPDFDYAIEDVAMYRYREKIEKSQVSTYTRAGWFDAEVAKGVLQKYLTFNTPQKLVIGPTGHNLKNIVNPYEEETFDLYISTS